MFFFTFARYFGAVLQRGLRLCLVFVWITPQYYGMVTLPALDPIPVPLKLCNSFGRTAKPGVWPIRHWGGGAQSSP